MKNRLFCVGAEVRPSPASGQARDFVSCHVNVYAAANTLREALERAEGALRRDGYEVSFIRGCWVVDAACNDGFCPADELPTEVSGELMFSDEVHYGAFRELSSESDYVY